MARSIRQLTRLGIVLLLLGEFASAMENTGRYFPFSSRPEKAWYKPGPEFDVDLFFASGHNIAKEHSAPYGIGQIWGPYDLQQIVNAMDELNMATSQIKMLIGPMFVNTPVFFNVHGKLRSEGVALRYTWPLPCQVPLTFGASLPVLSVQSDFRYSLDQNLFNQTYALKSQTLPGVNSPVASDTTWLFYQDKLDQARRLAHETIGFKDTRSTQVGIGDLDLFFRANFCFDHRFLMRSLDLAVQWGIVAPTGLHFSDDVPASIPFGNDGNIAFYAQFTPTIELKDDLRIGFLFRGEHLFPHTRTRRLPVFQEPFLYTPLKGEVRTLPGNNFILNAFMILENLYDGVHAQARYNYKRHEADKWQDLRSATEKEAAPSYLSRTTLPSGITSTASLDVINKVINAKEQLSKYRSHYITIQLAYDPLEAQQDLILKPKFYASFECPLFESSDAILQVNQITVGAELHF